MCLLLSFLECAVSHCSKFISFSPSHSCLPNVVQKSASPKLISAVVHINAFCLLLSFFYRKLLLLKMCCLFSHVPTISLSYFYLAGTCTCTHHICLCLSNLVTCNSTTVSRTRGKSILSQVTTVNVGNVLSICHSL